MKEGGREGKGAGLTSELVEEEEGEDEDQDEVEVK